MRLIDADYITEGRVSNDPVVIAAKCAPTIDAIPVEWIISWSNKRYRETQKDVSIVDVLAAWKQEQEAQDGWIRRSNEAEKENVQFDFVLQV